MSRPRVSSTRLSATPRPSRPSSRRRSSWRPSNRSSSRSRSRRRRSRGSSCSSSSNSNRHLRVGPSSCCNGTTRTRKCLLCFDAPRAQMTFDRVASIREVHCEPMYTCMLVGEWPLLCVSLSRCPRLSSLACRLACMSVRTRNTGISDAVFFVFPA